MSKIRANRWETLDGIGAGVIYVDTVADLQALDTSGLVEGQAASVQGSEFRWNGGEWEPMGPVAPRAFGAKPGEDSHASLQLWLDSGYKSLIINDHYLTSSTLHLSTEGVEIFSTGVGGIEQISEGVPALRSDHVSGITIEGVRLVAQPDSSVAVFNLCPRLTVTRCSIESDGEQDTPSNISGISVVSTSSGEFDSAENIRISFCNFKVANKPVLIQASDSFGGFDHVSIISNNFDCSLFHPDAMEDVLKIDGNGEGNISSVIVADNQIFVPGGTAVRDCIIIEEGVSGIVVRGNIICGEGSCRNGVHLFHAQKQESVNSCIISGNVIKGLGGLSNSRAVSVGIDNVFESVIIQGNIIEGFSGAGIVYWSSPQSSKGVSIANNIMRDVDASQISGTGNIEEILFVRNSDGVLICENQIINCKRRITVRNCKNFKFKSNYIDSPIRISSVISAEGSYVGNTLLAFGLDPSENAAIIVGSDTQIARNKIHTDIGNALRINGSGVSVENNELQSQSDTIAHFDGWSNAKVSGNKGFKTRANGIESASDGYQIDHGLDRLFGGVPGDSAGVPYSVTLTAHDPNILLHIQNIDSSVIVVGIRDSSNNPVQDDVDFSWALVSGLEMFNG